MKELTLKKIDCEHLLGTFLDESHYDTVIDFDCDVYAEDVLNSGPPWNGEHNVILKFRKGWFNKEEQAGAYDGLKDAAKPSQNRGLAAGPKGAKLQGRDWVTVEQMKILEFLAKVEAMPTLDDINVIRARAKTQTDTRGLVWLGTEKDKYNFNWDRWLSEVLTLPNAPSIRVQAEFVLNTHISDTTYANPVDSGIAGWFDRYPRIPYGRATAYTAQNYEKFQKSWPFLKTLSRGFEQLLPERFKTQMGYANAIDPTFRVPGTPFTTITVNKNFRTAAHRDAGDLTTGFSNLTVVAKDHDFAGGYLVIPEIRAAVNIRPGDLLLVNNHEYIHGNTPIVSKEGVELERISLVCYFREAMKDLGTREYEDLRYAYVEERRLNKQHALWRDGWNGVSHGMWIDSEWYNYIQEKGKPYMLERYHPEYQSQGSSLEDMLFGG